MCIICVDYNKQLITADEVRRNIGEMTLDRAHELEILLMLEKDKLDELEAKGLYPTPKK